MPLVNAKCTNCGADLKVNSNKDAAVCEFCGSAFIVEKAINNYNVVNNTNISANVVNVYGNVESPFYVVAGKLVKYRGSNSSVIIPKQVQIIGEDAFEGCSGITAIVIPDSVQEIESRAFAECRNLTEIEIPNSVRILGKAAFYNCSNLTKVTLSNNITAIEVATFHNCYSLNSLIIPDSVRKIGGSDFFGFGDSVFSGCSQLTHLAIPEGITTIEDNSFQDCDGLRSISLPSSLKTIGNYAFAGCISLEEIVIPENVTSVGRCAFKGCKNLPCIRIPSNVETIGVDSLSMCKKVIFTSNKINSLYDVFIDNDIDSNTISNNIYLQHLCFIEGVTAVNLNDLQACSRLEELTFDDGVETVCGHLDPVYHDWERKYVRMSINPAGICDGWITSSFPNQQIKKIHASEKWKRAHKELFPCLSLPSQDKSVSSQNKKSGCFIATAVYGCYDCPQVWTLRRYRDNILASTWYGRFFIRTYYALSPRLVNQFGHATWFKKLWRRRLDCIISKLQSRGIESTPYQDRIW